MGMTKRTLDWIKKLLYNRQQCVAIDGENSVLGPVLLGIPQGSVIALVLFVIYVKRLTCNFLYDIVVEKWLKIVCFFLLIINCNETDQFFFQYNNFVSWSWVNK